MNLALRHRLRALRGLWHPEERGRKRRRGKFLRIWTPAFFMTLCALGFAYAHVRPDIGEARYTLPGGTQGTSPMPLLLEEQSDVFIVRVPVRIAVRHTGTLWIIADDCLEELHINGEEVRQEEIPYCDATNGRSLDLNDRLVIGENMLEMHIRDNGGKAGVNVRPAGRGGWYGVLLAAALLSMLLYGFAAMRAFAGTARSRFLAAVFVIGCLLHAAYSLATPFSTRAYDVDGHVEYVRYVADTFSIPPAQDGWQFYQPPLYYFLTGGIVRFAEAFGMSAGHAVDHLGLFSLLLSVLALGSAAALARRLFCDTEDAWQPSLFLASVMFLPGIVYFSSRITNDVLLLLGTFVFFWLLVGWWQTGKRSLWYGTIAALSVALLGKSNALPLIPLAFVCLVFHPAWSIGRKLKHGAGAAALLLLATGWVFILRFVLEGETFIVGNRLNDGLGITNTWSHLFAFHPYTLVSVPFNDTWDDAYRRQYFWEFFLKSFFFGEWKFQNLPLMPSLARGMLILLVTCIPVTLFGIWQDAWKRFRHTFPLLLALAALLGSVFLYRVISPYSPNQDFRFVPLLIVPISYYLIRGIEELPGYMRLLMRGCAMALIGFDILFLILLLMQE